jgi:hypothetical protein
MVSARAGHVNLRSGRKNARTARTEELIDCRLAVRSEIRERRNGVAVEQRNVGFRRGVKSKGFRAGQDTSLPKRGPDAGTTDQVRPEAFSDGTDHA